MDVIDKQLAIANEQTLIELSNKGIYKRALKESENMTLSAEKIHECYFRRAVWDILLTIPYGHTMTYGEISDIMAKQKCVSKMSAQAVGGAVGHNPVTLIVPCHRVVGAGGNLTGYAGGTDKKLRLLKLEGADISSLYIPAKGTAL